MTNISELKANKEEILGKLQATYLAENLGSVKDIALNAVKDFELHPMQRSKLDTIKEASNWDIIHKELEILLSANINNQIRELLKDNKLAYVLDYTSGSSWEGTHYRNIKVEVISEDGTHPANMKLKVTNNYMGSSIQRTFTGRELFELNATDLIKHTYYYYQYLTESKSILESINRVFAKDLAMTNFKARKDRIKKRHIPQIKGIRKI